MNEILKKRMYNLESRVQGLEDANILYGGTIEDLSHINGFRYKKAELNKVVEKLLDYLGLEFSVKPPARSNNILIDKKTRKTDT